MRREEPDGSHGLRLDLFLDVACLFPTRSQAARACDGGKVDVNGQSARPHKLVRVGDRLEITLPAGRRVVVVKALAVRHVPKAVARTLYEDVTPPVPPEVLEVRRLERLLASQRDEGRPSKKERRDLSRARGRS